MMMIAFLLSMVSLACGVAMSQLSFYTVPLHAQNNNI